ncbi:hypothetical protein [Nocardia wallacei]|uniref:hypothetical protein n=1 Tax=Nocardia wallacei TaxID=480035 RepID=UPI002458BF41|nr:hypothetical protein [Nocardia wallacei]
MSADAAISVDAAMSVDAEIAALAQRVATARGKLPLQTDPALFDELSESEIAAERDLAEWIRAQRRRQRRRAVSAELSAEKRDRRVAAALRRADDADARWHRKALAARRRVSNPDARLAQLYRRAEWSSRALIGVVVLGMVWAGVNVQHNLVPSGDMSDPLYWLSYGFEAMISIPIITIMVVATTAARWGREIARGKVVFLEAALLGVTVALNAGPHVAAGAPARAAEAAVAPVMVGVVIWLHAWVSARYAQLIDAIPDQSTSTPRTVTHRIVDAFAPLRDGSGEASRRLAAVAESPYPSVLHGLSETPSGHGHPAPHTHGNPHPTTTSGHTEPPGHPHTTPTSGTAHNGHPHPAAHTYDHDQPTARVNGNAYPAVQPNDRPHPAAHTNGHPHPATQIDGHADLTAQTNGHTYPTAQSDSHHRPAAVTNGNTYPAAQTDGRTHPLAGSNDHAHPTARTNGQAPMAQPNGHTRPVTQSDDHASAAAQTNGRARPAGQANGYAYPLVTPARHDGEGYPTGRTNGNPYSSTAAEKSGTAGEAPTQPTTGAAHNGHGHTNGKTYPSASPEEADPMGYADLPPGSGPASNGHPVAGAADEPSAAVPSDGDYSAGHAIEADAEDVNRYPASEDGSETDVSAAGRAVTAEVSADPEATATGQSATSPTGTPSKRDMAELDGERPDSGSERKPRARKNSQQGAQLALDEPAPIDVTKYRHPFAVTDNEAVEEDSTDTRATAADLAAEIDNVGVWAVAREISERRLSKLPVEQLAEILALADESWTPAAIGASIGLPGSRILGILEAARRIRRPYAVSG